MTTEDGSFSPEMCPIDALRPHPRNYRVHPEDEVTHLMESIRAHGVYRNIVAARDGTILAGHGVVEACRRLGLGSVPVVRLPLDPDDPRALKVLVADNEIAHLAESDDRVLTELLKEVQQTDAVGLLGTGFDRDDVDELLRQVGQAAELMPDPGTQMDRAEELRKKWGTERGQLWEIGKHRLLCGDSTSGEDVGRLIGSISMAAVIADPPYGMNLNTDWSGIRGTGKSMGVAKKIRGKAYSPVVGDDVPYDPLPMLQLWAVGVSEVFLFGADYYAERIPERMAGSWLVWDKRKETQEDGFGSEFELIWSRIRHKRRMLRHEWFGFLRESEHGQPRMHPTQKPVMLIADIINQWCSGESLADPYAGSGTTMVAAEQLGRICYGMEIEPKYCAVTLERMADMGLISKLIE